jgi:hypothetical protein
VQDWRIMNTAAVSASVIVQPSVVQPSVTGNANAGNANTEEAKITDSTNVQVTATGIPQSTNAVTQEAEAADNQELILDEEEITEPTQAKTDETTAAVTEAAGAVNKGLQIINKDGETADGVTNAPITGGAEDQTISNRDEGGEMMMGRSSGSNYSGNGMDGEIVNTETAPAGGMNAAKDPLLCSWPFVTGISVVVLLGSIALGAFLAKLKIRKGINLYED